jgi:hypothetical protein
MQEPPQAKSVTEGDNSRLHQLSDEDEKQCDVRKSEDTSEYPTGLRLATIVVALGLGNLLSLPSSQLQSQILRTNSKVSQTSPGTATRCSL